MRFRWWNDYPDTSYGAVFNWTHNLRFHCDGEYKEIVPGYRWYVSIHLGRFAIELTPGKWVIKKE